MTWLIQTYFSIKNTKITEKLFKYRELPHIIFPRNNVKVLIEIRSTVSHSQITYKLYSKYIIKNDSFVDSTDFQKLFHNCSSSISAFKIVNPPNPNDLKFFYSNFTLFLMGFIDLDNHKILQGTLIFVKFYFIPPYTQLKLNSDKTQLNSDQC